MGDSETVVAQASSMTDFPNVSYDPANYPITDAAAGDNPAATVASSGPSANEAYSLPDGSSLVGESSFGAEADMQVASNSGEASAFVDEQTNKGSLVSESTYASFSANGATENGSVSAEAQIVDGSAVSTEEDRLWIIVRSNCLDFNAWTALIQETEKVAEDNIEKIRRVYDTFLAEFPLCYGYWKKYADHEARLGAMDKVVEVYERAVLAVTYSVDIWLHYCAFAISTYEDPNIIRRLFERGLAYVGTDYLSAPLWDKYIEFEYSQQQWSQLAMIYTRILENPIQQLDRYYSSFKELAAHRPLSEIQTVEDAAAMVMPANVETNERQGGDEGEPCGDEQLSPKPLSSGLTEAEELENYIAIREELYKKAKEFDSKILEFETAIRRPYFHVRPLDEAQLVNWHNYLDFIETVGDFNKVVKLYERCLIACANYPEYWIRYVLCMEASGSMELATNALARAIQVFVKRQPEIHLFAARFKEQTGDVSGARVEYQLIYNDLSPGLLEAIIKHANMEYRLGNPETAYTVYEEVIASEQQKVESQVLPILYLQYSRFLYLVAGNSDKAKVILERALEHVPLSKPLIEAVIHLESIQLPPKRIDYLDSLVEKFITTSPDVNTISSLDREEISSIFLEFLDLFGDAQAIKKADNRHAKLFLHQKTTSMSRKRNAEDYLSSEKAKLVKSSAGAPSAQSIMGAYPSSQNQWSAGYALQPQAWPAAPQSQGQQWNAGYGQQAAYTGYSGYGGYTHPQVPSSAPQTGGYGAYPAAHPAQQATPPQTYAQSTPAFTPGQQQTTGPQASYFGSYY